MESVDIVVIGAGVAGLAIASRLASPRCDLVVLERHDGFGRETSSRNSEVIHAGFYYPAQSLKTRLCTAGNPLLYSWCQQHGVAHRMCGKILVASGNEEVEKLHCLLKQGASNGVQGMCMLSASLLRQLEPDVNALEGLWSPSTGIVDTHGLMRSFEFQTRERGALIAYQCTVTSIEKTSHGFVVGFQDCDGTVARINAGVVINAAGLGCDEVAAMAGIDIDAAGYRLHPCKGDYFRVHARHNRRLSHLVYPVPTACSLGVHAVLGLDGCLRLGPDAHYVTDRADYSVDQGRAAAFYKAAHRYLPFINPDDLRADQSGIRPKLQKDGEIFSDFIISEESGRGLSGMVNLIGIESPGLTACCAIADYVADLLGR